MSKQIVIIPCFGEAHFTSLQIDNLVNTLKPDYIIYNEGLFPQGPENKGGVDDNFKKEFCFNNTNLAWDTELLQSVIKLSQEKYPNTKIIWNPMSYNINNANICYLQAVSNFSNLGVDIEEGDIIFPLEGDVFFHKNDIDLLNEYLNKLNPDQGLSAPYLDFIENQYYVEGESLDVNKIHKRRIAIKFGSWDYYNEVCVNFMSQKYPQLIVFPRYIFHYAWWRPGKYKDLRFRQLVRSEEYRSNFKKGLELAKENKLDSIIIRPNKSENDLNRIIVKISIDHPKEVMKHSNWIK